MKFLEENLIRLKAEVETAQEAIEAAGSMLLKEQLVESTYINAMVNAYHANGPYFVLAPHIAIPHARPEDGVKEASVSLVTLKEPIKFGHATNDPVRLVFGLGASSSEEHLTVLRSLTNLLNDSGNVEGLKNASCYEDIKTILEKER
ncbi:PTS sugar transporter subunit IIA [Lentibacillus sediminis]|uniref:PTS sugar transporter subunit IIA n=1 Tax=Lentibacillus sediminis TaxID=1940529 RepID=UPI000C1BB55E|nr:PTS sugar transporter subunit IIA [Lentibacillus sediminis]